MSPYLRLQWVLLYLSITMPPSSTEFSASLSVELLLRYMEINAEKIIYVSILHNARLKNCKTFYQEFVHCLIYKWIIDRFLLLFFPFLPNNLIIQLLIKVYFFIFIILLNELKFNFSIILL